MLFGKERLRKDITALENMTNLTAEQYSVELGKSIGRFAGTNLNAGIVLGGAASIMGILLHYVPKIIKEKKKCKELKDTDK